MVHRAPITESRTDLVRFIMEQFEAAMLLAGVIRRRVPLPISVLDHVSQDRTKKLSFILNLLHGKAQGQSHDLFGRRRRRRRRRTTLDHTLDHICFWQPPWKSKNAILHCKMYDFASFCKFLPIFAMLWRSKMPKNVCFSNFGRFWTKIVSKSSLQTADLRKKTYILQCKMYVFDSG